MMTANLPVAVWSDMFKLGRPFLKMHGLKNHFIIVDGRERSFAPPPDVIAQICSVDAGVGADQLLVIEPATLSAATLGAYARMRIYNVDGSEVQTCGNATRCVADLLLKVSEADQVLIETGGGNLRCWRNEASGQISVAMGTVNLEWHSIPLAQATDTLNVRMNHGPLQQAVALNIGNPHLVFFVDDLQSIDIPRYAALAQQDPLLPESANIGVAQIIGETAMRLTVWERPGILTQACGSGACCAVAAARAKGLIQSSIVTVYMPGGALTIEQDDMGQLILTGPTVVAFAGHLLETHEA